MPIPFTELIQEAISVLQDTIKTTNAIDIDLLAHKLAVAKNEPKWYCREAVYAAVKKMNLMKEVVG